MLRRGVLTCVLLLVPLVALSEIEKVGQVCEKDICLALLDDGMRRVRKDWSLNGGTRARGGQKTFLNSQIY